MDGFKVQGLAEQIPFVGAEVGRERKLYGHGCAVSLKRGRAADAFPYASPPATTPKQL